MTSIETERDLQVDRIRQALARLIRDSHLTQRQVEQANGFRKGYLSQVLKGHITLTVRHLLGILMTAGVEASDFFSRRSADDPSQLDEIRQKLARYDAAFEILEDKGLLEPDSRSSLPTGRAAPPLRDDDRP